MLCLSPQQLFYVVDDCERTSLALQSTNVPLIHLISLLWASSTCLSIERGYGRGWSGWERGNCRRCVVERLSLTFPICPRLEEKGQSLLNDVASQGRRNMEVRPVQIASMESGGGFAHSNTCSGVYSDNQSGDLIMAWHQPVCC